MVNVNEDLNSYTGMSNLDLGSTAKSQVTSRTDISAFRRNAEKMTPIQLLGNKRGSHLSPPYDAAYFRGNMPSFGLEDSPPLKKPMIEKVSSKLLQDTRILQNQFQKNIIEERKNRKLQVGEKKTPFTKFELNKSDSDDVEDPDAESEEEVERYSFPSNDKFNFNRSTIKKLNDQEVISEVIGTMKNEEIKLKQAATTNSANSYVVKDPSKFTKEAMSGKKSSTYISGHQIWDKSDQDFLADNSPMRNET